MKTIFNYVTELREHGIDYLTGESCAYSMRGLFDIINEDAAEKIAAFFGVKKLEMYPAWNNGIGSIMLPYKICKDLVVFLSLCDKTAYSVIVGDDFIIVTDNKEEHRGCIDCKMLEHVSVHFRKQVDRNQHQMSGRIL